MKKSIRASIVALVMGAALAASAENIMVDGSTTVGPIAKSFAEYYMKLHPEVNITVSESGSGNGAKGIINKAIDVGTMSRPMKEEERDAAAAKGVRVTEHIVAMDGLSAVVHPSNPIQDLTKQQLRQIYTGEITNWKDVGGPNMKIVVIGRDTNSGTYESWQTLVMKSDNVTEKAEICGSNGQIRQRVMSTPNAIGYVGLAFLDGVKALTVNGVAADPAKVISKEYPISRSLFMYTDGEPAAGTAKADFVNLYKTADGKKIVEEKGFVPMP